MQYHAYAQIIQQYDRKIAEYARLMRTATPAGTYYYVHGSTMVRMHYGDVVRMCERMIMKIENEKEKVTGMYIDHTVQY